jgi:mono/diheme cytochrome c family protein
LSNRSLRPVYFLVVISMLALPGCWEQWSASWFPQMKKQPAIQAFEDTEIAGHPQGLTPPDFTVPVDGGVAPVGQLDPWGGRGGQRLPGQGATDADANALENPRPFEDWQSLANGKAQYDTYCSVCHGTTGLADGPVAKVYGGVLPLVGVVKARSDGHIYATIRYGRRRMPPYGRIPERDRWDIVNYVRYLDQKGGRP